MTTDKKDLANLDKMYHVGLAYTEPIVQFEKMDEANQDGLVTNYDGTLKGMETFEIYIEEKIRKIVWQQWLPHIDYV